MMRLRGRRTHEVLDSSDQGFAMVTVLGIGTVMTALLLGSLGYALQTLPQTRRGQDWTQALAAAQAGVNDFLSRMNLSDTYGRVPDCKNLAVPGPGVAGCAAATPSWQNVAIGLPASGAFHYSYSEINPTEGINLKVTGRVNEQYRTLNVRVAQKSSTDYLYFSDLELTDPEDFRVYPAGNRAPAECGGTSPARYWWQGPAADPSNRPTFNADDGQRAGCAEIAFRAGDVLDGPVHFNDTPGLLGPKFGPPSFKPFFTEGYSTSDPNCDPTLPGFDRTDPPRFRCYRRYPYSVDKSIPSGWPAFKGTYGVSYLKPQGLKDNSSEFDNYPGCQYFGDTRIRLRDDGTMDVWNTKTAGQPENTVKPGSPASLNCGAKGSFAPGPDGIRPSSPVNVPIPQNQVIYVQDTGSAAKCRPGEIVNGAASGSVAGDVIPQGTGDLRTDVTDINFFNPNEVSNQVQQTFTKPAGATSTTAWVPGTTTRTETPVGEAEVGKLDCGLGNIYLEGELKGRVTIVAQNSIIITNNLKYDGVVAGASADTSEHLLGLSAVNSLLVYHPVTRAIKRNPATASSSLPSNPCSATVGERPPTAVNGQSTVTCTWTAVDDYDTYVDGTPKASNLPHPGLKPLGDDLYIHAGMQALQHSFQVQSPQHGTEMGSLSIRGSLAQRYRGTTLVGTAVGSSGFVKDYRYDDRLRFDEPPYFPRFSSSVWVVKTSGELKPEF